MRNFTQDEAKVIYKDAKSKGLNPDKVMSELVLKGATFDGVDMAQAKQYAQSQDPQTKPTIGQTLKEAGQDILGIRKDIVQSSTKRAENIGEIRNAVQSGEQGDVRSILQTGGQLAGAGADAIGALAKGVANVFLSDKTEKAITQGLGEKAQQVIQIPEVQSIIARYEALPEENKRDVDALGGVVSLITNFIGGEAVGTGTKAGVTAGKKVLDKGVDIVDTTVNATKKGVNETIENISQSGAGQVVRDIAERVPRAIQRGKENLADNAIRAEKIRTATPSVQQAIKTNLDERIINTVTEADDATKQAYKQVIDIAEETPKTVGLKKQPSIVGGDLASKQYDLINKQKKAVGEQIGELTKNLSKTEKLSMQDSFMQIDDTLASQGIVPTYTKKGVKLDFTGSKYTPAERTKIQELYNLATEGGDNLTPSQIKGKDQLFSKLKRESNFEGIGDLIIETPDGNKSLFNIFRDIYSSKLDTISPEVRDLNAQYRKLSSITDDIEDSIFKTPNFNVTKSVDPAEFAKVNLRRIFGEAQSSPTYQAIADLMDKSARQFGYEGASPKQVAEFAEYIRKLYPESIPKTGFQGGIKAGISDIIETVSKVGTPNIEDQRKALRGLFEDYLQSSKNTTTPKTKPKNPIRAVKSQMAKPKIIK